MTILFEWLNDYNKLIRKIEYVEYQLETSKAELKRWIEGDLQGVKLTRESQSSKLESHIKHYENQLQYLISRRKSLKDFIFRFDDLDSQILYKKYIEDKSLEEIAYEVGYSYSHIKKCHSRLVKTIRFVDINLSSD